MTQKTDNTADLGFDGRSTWHPSEIQELLSEEMIALRNHFKDDEDLIEKLLVEAMSEDDAIDALSLITDRIYYSHECVLDLMFAFNFKESYDKYKETA